MEGKQMKTINVRDTDYEKLSRLMEMTKQSEWEIFAEMLDCHTVIVEQWAADQKEKLDERKD
jgi:hypothetical protein